MGITITAWEETKGVSVVIKRIRGTRRGAKTCFAALVAEGIMIALFFLTLDLSSVCLSLECRDSRTKLAFGRGQHSCVQVERVK